MSALEAAGHEYACGGNRTGALRTAPGVRDPHFSDVGSDDYLLIVLARDIEDF
ncbi:hypothetical protein [Bradyrhizobium sp. OAE829]|uniref:hypothetical protein n=1 Tax=Bradyrhizobium sp. OAE829 TaxID=2663807 RepID=UPI00178B6D05